MTADLIWRARRWLGLHLMVIATYVYGTWRVTTYDKDGIQLERVKLP